MDCGRDQAFLLPPDLRDWIPEDDLAHFVIEAVERVDLGAFKVNRRGSGSAQYHPRMMLALLIYCYAKGIDTNASTQPGSTGHRRSGDRPNPIADCSFTTEAVRNYSGLTKDSRRLAARYGYTMLLISRVINIDPSYS